MDGPATVTATQADLEDVYRHHGTRLWRAVFAYAQDRHVADDAVAEAFAQALRRGSAIQSPEKWVWKAAFRIAAGHLQERRRSVPLMEVGSVRNPEPAWELLTALRQLPQQQRACVVLHYYGGYNTAEISRMVGSTSAAVRMQLTRGRRRLQQLVEGGEGDA
ncbi:MAG: sigma factor-like helix-turn-helix DNA-binding protein [Acidimicrobiia bacterium]|nr:sigma factor-like helix-turn-helix DNA-binding protein [Acidimicrobiia bacterium]